MAQASDSGEVWDNRGAEGGRVMTWDDERWRERGDNRWTRGCRWLQSRWREVELGLEAGPRSPAEPDRLVCSMLPLDAERSANFLSPEAHAAAEALLARGAGPGIVDEDRLLRNLLSSQPTCVNLFGPFVVDPDGLTGWVRSLDPECERVTEVRLEWAPPRGEHFDGGSAFDAFVEYVTHTGTRFVGVETKYAENLAASRISVRQVYRDFTEDSGFWSGGADRRLDTPALRQFWLNTLLAQSLREVGHDGTSYEHGLEVVVACAADESAALATHRVRGELHDPDGWLRWVPYEDVLAHLDPSIPWVDDFRARYLDAAGGTPPRC